METDHIPLASDLVTGKLEETTYQTFQPDKISSQLGQVHILQPFPFDTF
jgi:hypothetical protein